MEFIKYFKRQSLEFLTELMKERLIFAKMTPYELSKTIKVDQDFIDDLFSEDSQTIKNLDRILDHFKFNINIEKNKYFPYYLGVTKEICQITMKNYPYARLKYDFAKEKAYILTCKLKLRPSEKQFLINQMVDYINQDPQGKIAFKLNKLYGKNHKL